MSATVDLTEAAVLTVLRSFLLNVLPTPIEVVRGQINRVPSPAAQNYVIMTPTLRPRLSTNVVTYEDLPLASPPVGIRQALQATKLTVQLDVHGPLSANNAQIISTLFRDEYACDFFAATGLNMAPLYAEEPRQLTFVTGEDQYDMRWVVDVVLQINPIVTTQQQFADQLEIGIFEVDAEFPPT